ncbi:MAG: hypothetical protein Q9219_005897 [cf. Caloplaca sp. 3 TL-2023]
MAQQTPNSVDTPVSGASSLRLRLPTASPSTGPVSLSTSLPTPRISTFSGEANVTADAITAPVQGTEDSLVSNFNEFPGTEATLIPSRDDDYNTFVAPRPSTAPEAWRVGVNLQEWELGIFRPLRIAHVPWTAPDDPGIFFNDAFHPPRWQEGQFSDLQNEASLRSNVASPALMAAAMVSPPTGFLSPRSIAPYSHNAPSTSSRQEAHQLNQVMRRATNIAVEDPPQSPGRPLCTAADCPVGPVFHTEGPYVHDNIPATNHLETFGPSNPPPEVWQAIHRGCHWVGTQQDADLISRFIQYHGLRGNFFIVPHTNFLWGEEAASPNAVPGAPAIRLPFPAMPLRIAFDASLNLPEPPDPPVTSTHGAAHGPTYHQCMDPTCPIREEHGQGIYFHNNELPRIRSAIFGYSNPPENVWRALDRVTRAETYDQRATNSDRWTVTHFARLHAGVNV